MPFIKTIAELKKHLPVAYVSSAGSMPGFHVVEERYLRPVLGAALMDLLQEHYDAGELEERDKPLLEKCQAVIAPLAYLEDLVFMQVRLSDNGVIALEAENQRKAFKWEYLEAQRALEMRGFDALEALIAFLRTNYGTYKDEWQSAPYNDPAQFSLIRNGADFGTDIALRHPQRTYSIVKPLFRMVESIYIERALGAQFYAALNDRLLQENFNEYDERLMKMLRPAVARWVMMVAADELHIRFGDNGFTVTDGGIKDNVDEGRAAASRLQLQDFKANMDQKASLFLSKAIDYLNANASEEVFPEFWASSKYVNPLTAKPVRHENDSRRGFFVAG